VTCPPGGDPQEKALPENRRGLFLSIQCRSDASGGAADLLVPARSLEALDQAAEIFALDAVAPHQDADQRVVDEV
jgi:hypothetical protein